MIRDDETNRNDTDYLAHGPFSLTDNDVGAAWQQFCAEHIEPSRLFSLSVGLDSQTDSERAHLASCDKCRRFVERYLSESSGNVDEIGTYDRILTSKNHACQTRQPIRRPNGVGTLTQRRLSVFEHLGNGNVAPPVPEFIAKQLRVKGPVLFPAGEVADETWQFGRIEQFVKDNSDIADRLINAIVERAKMVLLPWARRRRLVLVCFGAAMHRCGAHLATHFVDDGEKSPHVVLAHDFYSPTLLCDPTEFRDADVVVVCDVLHTGGLLERLFDACRAYEPSSIRGLVIVDQSGGAPRSEECLALWAEDQERRVTLSDFEKSASQIDLQQLRCFEPNEECAVAVESISVEPTRCVPRQEPAADPELVELIYSSDALKCDYTIGQNTYPYAINILDLMNDADARKRILVGAADELSDLKGRRTCLAYNFGRAKRAGAIAKALSEFSGWPAIAVGTRGHFFNLTDEQCARLLHYECIVVVDAAVRTGDSIAAMLSALDKRKLRIGRTCISFSVLDALTEASRGELSARLGIDIRTLFTVPLSPPTERVRHWVNQQKSDLGRLLLESREFSGLEPLLRSYCHPSRRGPKSNKQSRSLPKTIKLMRGALQDAQLAQQPIEAISTACREGNASLLGRLPLDQVVHNRGIQRLLKGIMYNSMKPRFKENAAFALAAANNYDWMDYEWLRCNRHFLASRTDSWKAVAMIECRLKLSGRSFELANFHDALKKFSSASLKQAGGHPPRERQHELHLEDQSDAAMSTTMAIVRNAESRLGERVKVLIELAS